MKMSGKIINWKNVSRSLGVVIGIAAIYLSLKNVQGEDVKRALSSMNAYWIVPIVMLNFGIVALKALRWQIMIRPVKKINFSMMYKALTIGFMANNILPARLGEAVRIHVLGRDASVSRLTTTATLVADRVIESISFLIMAALLMMLTSVPRWLHFGLLSALILTGIFYAAAAVYSKKDIKEGLLSRFQDGLRPLLHLRTASLALVISTLSWLAQGLLLYMTQLAYGVDLPIWGILLVLISINLAIALPSAPGNIGTFEFACILAYSYLGIDKNLGLLMGATFHLLQAIPITLAGGLMVLLSPSRNEKPLISPAPDTPY